MQLIGFLLFGATILLLGIVKSIEGWKKALQISAAWLATIGIVAMTLEALKIERESAVYMTIGLFVLGIWTVGILLYGMKKGYISKPWKS